MWRSAFSREQKTGPLLNDSVDRAPPGCMIGSSPMETPPRRNRWAGMVPCLLIILAGAAAYSDSLWAPFEFDDFPSIVDNPSVKRLWPLTIVDAPRGIGQPRCVVVAEPVLGRPAVGRRQQ